MSGSSTAQFDAAGLRCEMIAEIEPEHHTPRF
jgi:hypothetical protein